MGCSEDFNGNTGYSRSCLKPRRFHSNFALQSSFDPISWRTHTTSDSLPASNSKTTSSTWSMPPALERRLSRWRAIASGNVGSTTLFVCQVSHGLLFPPTLRIADTFSLGLFNASPKYSWISSLSKVSRGESARLCLRWMTASLSSVSPAFLFLFLRGFRLTFSI